MRILLIGEYSRFHNSLKEGLEVLGHEVLLVGTGDYFKRFPVDINTDATLFKHNKILNFFRQLVFRCTRLDLAYTETAIRYLWHSRKYKGFDVVQLINSNAIKTHLPLEKYLISKLKKNNSKLFLSACGDDYHCISYMLDKPAFKYHVLTPYLQDKSLKETFSAPLRYVTKPYKKHYDFVYKQCDGIIASDMDYHIPLIGDKKYLGLISNPINIDLLDFQPLVIDDKIHIFHGINRASAIKKGNQIIQEALDEVQQLYPEDIVVKTTYSLPYKEYIQVNKDSHIIMDQVYGYDQGYNALESMARGKVVFTGAEKEFESFYKLDKKVAINATPDKEQIIAELKYLITHKNEIVAIGKRARAFIEKEHHYVKIAQRYIDTWTAIK